MSEHERQRMVGVRYRTFREILTLLLKTFSVSDEFLAVEVGGKTDRGAQNPIRADDACHATPYVRHVNGKTSLGVYRWTVKRDSISGVLIGPRARLSSHPGNQEPSPRESGTDSATMAKM